MVTSNVSQHSSSDDDKGQIVTNEPRVIKLKRRNKVKIWIMEHVYSNKEDAMNTILNEEIWSYYFYNDTNEGKKYFKCSQVHRNGIQCQTGLYISIKSDN